MSSSTILQLRQQESSDVTQNGVWRATIDHPIQLEEGDVVQVKSVYLDTVSDVIEVSEDTSVTMEAVMYLQNYNLDQRYPYVIGGDAPLRIYQDDATFRSVGEKGDNHLWFLSSAHQAVGATNWNVKSCVITPTNTTSDTKRFGDITLTWEYTPILAGAGKTTQSVHITSKVDKHYAKWNPWPVGVSCTGTAQAPNITLLTTQDELNNAGIASVEIPALPAYRDLIPAGEWQIEPERFPITFNVPRGTYTPSEIAQLITDSVNNVQYAGKVTTQYGAGSATNPITQTSWPSMSPWLQTILRHRQSLHVSSGGTAAQIFVNADARYGGDKGGGAMYFSYDVAKMQGEYSNVPYPNFRPPLDKFIGTNQFSMEFDSDENKIKMTQMHFPLYVNDTTTTTTSEDGLPGVVFNEPQPSVAPHANYLMPDGGIASAYSGLTFSSLTPAWFWDTLGFGQAVVNPIKNATMNYPQFGSASPTVDNSYTLQVDVGKTTTSAYEGLDLPVKHANAYKYIPPALPTQFGQYSVPRFDDQGTLDTYISTSDVESIFSSVTLNDNIADEGYFLIDVASNFKQNMISGKLNGAIQHSTETQSIVNRYYTSGSFTSDQGAGSIVYEHIGQPQMLSNFAIKVRNPNGSFVSDTVLKTKNTVFIEIVKQPKQQNNKKN